jgi:hypothetical protein
MPPGTPLTCLRLPRLVLADVSRREVRRLVRENEPLPDSVRDHDPRVALRHLLLLLVAHTLSHRHWAARPEMRTIRKSPSIRS